MQDLVGTAASRPSIPPGPEARSRRRRAGAFDEPILRLLLNGAPDKAIAARLRVSERTVQRHVRLLLTKVGAHNRMQLGQILARRARDGAQTCSEGGGDTRSDRGVRGGFDAGPDTVAQHHRLTDFDAQVLRRLLDGTPENAIAEALRVSRRTVQRSVKGLMTRAGAANRVQLGWYAQHNGWI